MNFKLHVLVDYLHKIERDNLELMNLKDIYLEKKLMNQSYWVYLINLRF